MSLGIALNNALSGLQSNQAVIQTISNNVANANTEGYTRKTVDQISRTLDAQGRGVDTSDIKRVVDERLLLDLRRNIAGLSASQTKDAYYQRVIDQFGTLSSNSSLGAGLSNLATALQDLAASPESTANRIEVVTNAVSLTQQINRMSAQIQSLRAEADREISTKITVLNGELKNFADLNTKIEGLQAVGEPTGELEDFRDKSLNAIAELIDIRYFKRTTGEIVITLPDGKVLADKNFKPMSHDPASGLSADIAYPGNGINPILLGGADVTATLGAGELSALVDVRDRILPDLQAEMDLLTQTMRDELNALHNAGTGLPPASTLTGTRAFDDPASAQITLTATTRIAVVDETGKFVRHFDLTAGTYSVDQIETAIDTNLAGFATASTQVGGPLSIAATGTKQGIAIVDIGAQTVTQNTFGKITTVSGFSNFFGLNDLFVTPGRVQGDSSTGISAGFQVRADIVNDPARLSRGTLNATVTPAPVAGGLALSQGDSSIVQALADKFVGNLQFGAAGNLPPTETTLAGYASDILSATAVEASIAKSDAEFRETLLQEQNFRVQEVGGVNLDEELSNLVIYENAYGATARVYQVIDDLLDTLVNLGR